MPESWLDPAVVSLDAGAWIANRLTVAEAESFAARGYLVVCDALPGPALRGLEGEFHAFTSGVCILEYNILEGVQIGRLAWPHCFE
jgi:hypothetical protein